MGTDRTQGTSYPPDAVIDAWAADDGSVVDLGPLLAWAENPDGPPPAGWSLSPGHRRGRFTYGCMEGQAAVSPGFAFDGRVVPDGP